MQQVTILMGEPLGFLNASPLFLLAIVIKFTLELLQRRSVRDGARASFRKASMIDIRRPMFQVGSKATQCGYMKCGLRLASCAEMTVMPIYWDAWPVVRV